MVILDLDVINRGAVAAVMPLSVLVHIQQVLVVRHVQPIPGRTVPRFCIQHHLISVAPIRLLPAVGQIDRLYPSLIGIAVGIQRAVILYYIIITNTQHHVSALKLVGALPHRLFVQPHFVGGFFKGRQGVVFLPAVRPIEHITAVVIAALPISTELAKFRMLKNQVGNHAVHAERVVGSNGQDSRPPPVPFGELGEIQHYHFLVFITEGVHHPLGYGLTDAVFGARHHQIAHLQFVYRRPAFFRFYQGALHKAAHAGGEGVFFRLFVDKFVHCISREIVFQGIRLEVVKGFRREEGGEVGLRVAVGNRRGGRLYQALLDLHHLQRPVGRNQVFVDVFVEVRRNAVQPFHRLLGIAELFGFGQPDDFFGMPESQLAPYVPEDRAARTVGNGAAQAADIGLYFGQLQFERYGIVH